MELRDALRTTGAVREFEPTPVDDATVYRILDTARFAPNGGNRQAWRIVMVKDRAAGGSLRDAYLPGWYDYLAQVGRGLTPWAVVTDVERERRAIEGAPAIAAEAAAGPGGFAEHFDRVPVLLVLLADLTRMSTVDRDADRYTMVGGASIYPFAWSILLAARDEDLGGVMTTMVVRNEQSVRELLRVPDTASGRRGARARASGASSDPVAQASVETFATVDRFDGDPLAAG